MSFHFYSHFGGCSVWCCWIVSCYIVYEFEVTVTAVVTSVFLMWPGMSRRLVLSVRCEHSPGDPEPSAVTKSTSRGIQSKLCERSIWLQPWYCQQQHSLNTRPFDTVHVDGTGWTRQCCRDLSRLSRTVLLSCCSLHRSGKHWRIYRATLYRRKLLGSFSPWESKRRSKLCKISIEWFLYSHMKLWLTLLLAASFLSPLRTHPSLWSQLHTRKPLSLHLEEVWLYRGDTFWPQTDKNTNTHTDSQGENDTSVAVAAAENTH